MAISNYATTCDGRLDPHEALDFIVSMAGVLESGEAMDAGFTLSVTAEAAALGLTILDLGDGYADPALVETDTGIQLWLGIALAYQTNAAFDGEGTYLAFELLTDTDSAPARTRNRTFKVQVAQL